MTVTTALQTKLPDAHIETKNEAHMNTSSNTAQSESNYNRFITELTALTRKYGVAIKSVGGVFLANELDEFANVTYTADISSGDLYPNLPES